MSSTARIRLLLVPLVALLVVAGVVGGAAASQPTSASGTLTYTASTFNDVRSAGGNTIIGDLNATVSYTGTFSGTSTVQGTLILHPNGSANFHDVETFTGTVNGVFGTVTFNLNGSSDPEGNVRATAVIVSATGGLTGLHGVLKEIGTVPSPTGPEATYTGQIHRSNR